MANNKACSILIKTKFHSFFNTSLPFLILTRHELEELSIVGGVLQLLFQYVRVFFSGTSIPVFVILVGGAKAQFHLRIWLLRLLFDDLLVVGVSDDDKIMPHFVTKCVVYWKHQS